MESGYILPEKDVNQIVEKLDKIIEVLHKQQEREKIIISNDEFVRLLSISKRTAQNWRDEGIIAFSQIGSKIFYQMSDIKALLMKTKRTIF